MNRAIGSFVIGLLILLFSCTSHKPPPTIQSPAPELMIVSTSDFHSFLEKAEGLASVIQNLRQRHGDSMLYLDGGDLFQGSLEGNLSKGEATVKFMNFVGLDAAAIGNHELDYGPDVPDRVQVLPGEDGLGNLKKRVSEASFAWLSSNFVVDPIQKCNPDKENHCNALSQKTLFQPRTVIERGGYKIGIIGATTATTSKITQPAFVQGTRFEEIAPITIAEANYLRHKKGCDLILLLAHEGARRNLSDTYRKDIGIVPILNQIPPGTIDAAICGHSHIRVQERIAGIPVLQSGLYGQVVGRMKVKGRNPVEISYESFIEIPAKAITPDVTNLLAPYREKAAELKKMPIGICAGLFKKNSQVENALGNMIADAFRNAGEKIGGAQFSVLNAGGIRNDLPEGPITYGDLFKVLPFENLLVIAKLKGSELRRMLEIGLSGALGESPISGLKVVRLDVPPGVAGPWDRDLDGNGFKETWERNLLTVVEDLEGNPIEDDATYTIATIDYLTNGGDYQSAVFNNVPPERIQIYSEFPQRDVVLQYIQQHSPLDPMEFFTLQSRRIVATPPSIN